MSDDIYLAALRDAFDRWLANVVKPLRQQNHDLKLALTDERKRAAKLADELAEEVRAKAP